MGRSGESKLVLTEHHSPHLVGLPVTASGHDTPASDAHLQ
jgi:hypothetical protein